MHQRAPHAASQDDRTASSEYEAAPELPPTGFTHFSRPLTADANGDSKAGSDWASAVSPARFRRGQVRVLAPGAALKA